MKITVLGLGNMGLPMAERLCRASFDVSVWNRTPGKADNLVLLGAAAHTHAASAVKDADIVVSMLENGPVVEDVLFNQGVAAALKPGALVIDMASIKPREARDHAARLGALGIAHLDAPVSGGVLGAEDGKLVIMVGGKVLILNVHSPCLHTLDVRRMSVRMGAVSLPSWPTR